LNNVNSADEIHIQNSPSKFEHNLTEQSPISFESPNNDKDLKSSEHCDVIEVPVHLPSSPPIISAIEHSNYSFVLENVDEYNQSEILGLKSSLDLLFTQIPTLGEESFETQEGSNESSPIGSLDGSNNHDLQSNPSVNSIKVIQPAIDIHDETQNSPQSEPFRDNTNLHFLPNFVTHWSLETVGDDVVGFGDQMDENHFNF
jgi:hypothetical protein